MGRRGYDCRRFKVPARCGMLGSMKVHKNIRALVLFAAVAVPAFGGAAIWWRNHPRPPVTDIARYPEMRREVGSNAGADAIAFMPEAVPAMSKKSRMHAFASRGNSGAELILLCILPSEEARRIAEASRAAAGTLQESGGMNRKPDGLRGREIPSICTEGDLPKSYEVILLYNHEVSAGTDESHVWLLFDEATGTVVWWLERHWAPFN
jgi:hypothetical protein